jgi:hypothetical protein
MCIYKQQMLQSRWIQSDNLTRVQKAEIEKRLV